MTSRLPGFHRLPLEKRLAVLEAEAALSTEERDLLANPRPLDLAAADKMIENAIGVFALPMGLGVNLRVNDRDVLVPMVTEEPSIVAAASSSARLTRQAGGILADADPPLMVGQVQLIDVPDPFAAAARLQAEAPRLVELARELQPRMVARGGGARELEVEVLGPESILVHVILDVGDAMGANAINTLVEALAEPIREIAGGSVNLRILSNYTDRRLARASVAIPAAHLTQAEMTGEDVGRRIALASDFAAVSVHRATTHNKGVMNGIDSVALATGNDWRAIEAGAHAWAARSGRYGPLATWGFHDGVLRGQIELPLAVGTVGDRIRANPRATLALRLLSVSGARELAMVMAAVGLAQNLAALRALATEGIQRGHMRLHRRTVEPVAAAAALEVSANP